MAMTVTISPGTLILLLCLHNILAQQCFGNVGQQNLAGAPQQAKTCGLNQMAQNPGLNFNALPQQNMQQMNLQQLSNIQQPSTQQAGTLQQMNLQPASFQQSANPVTNSQLQNQNLAYNIFSALQSFRQAPQNTGTNPGRSELSPNCCNVKQNLEQASFPQSQNQAYPTYTVPILTNSQTINQPASASFSEYPLYAVQTSPSSNVPSQQTQQIFPAVVDSYTNGQIQDYPIRNQPTASQTAMQNPLNTGQSQPIVLTMQSPHMQTGQSSSLSTSQPIIYTVQTQPAPVSQNQLNPIPQNSGNDNQSLMSYIMSQMQNSQTQTNTNPLAAILPAMLNTKSEKSSSMKALLPIILNMLTDRSGCVCPHCGCDNRNHQPQVNTHEPIINTGYSNQKNYSQQETTEEVSSKSTEKINTDVKPTPKQASIKVIENKSEEPENKNVSQTSEEEDDEDMSEEDYDDD